MPHIAISCLRDEDHRSRRITWLGSRRLVVGSLDPRPTSLREVSIFPTVMIEQPQLPSCSLPKTPKVD